MSSTQEVGEIFGSGSGPAHAMLRSPTVLIASIGLWGMNVYFFKLFGIDYVKVLKFDLDEEKKHAEEHTYPAAAYSASGGTAASSYNGGGGGGSSTGSLGKNASAAAAIASSVVGVGNRLKATTSVGGSSAAAATPPLAAPEIDPYYYGDSDDSDDDYHQYYYDDNPPESSPLLVGGGGADPAGTSSSSSAATAGGGPAAVTWNRLVGFSLGLLLLLHVTYAFWIDGLNRSPLTAVFAFYGAVTTAVLVPLPGTRWLRRAVVIVLQRSFELFNPRCAACVPSDSGSNNSNNNLPPGAVQPASAVQPLPRAIPFVDVFFADAMCSLSKVFFDWGMLLHMAAHYPNPVPPSALNIVIPSAFAAVPFVIRARQCLVMYQIGRLTSQPNRFSHLANAVKYSTSIFPLVVSAYQKTVSAAASASLEPLLVLLLVVNALYALYWDVVMDWGLLQNPAAACKSYYYYRASSSSSAIPHASSAAPMSSSSLAAAATSGAGASAAGPASSAANGDASSAPSSKHHHHHVSLSHLRQAAPPICHHLMRPRLRFGVVMSLLIVLSDSVLRFSWTLRFYHMLFPSGDSFVLCTQFLEVFRRALWNLLRIEWEHMRQRVRRRQSLVAAKKKHHGDPASSAGHAAGLMGGANGGGSAIDAGMATGTTGSHHGGGAIGGGVGGVVVGGGGGVGSSAMGGGPGGVVASASELTSYILSSAKRTKEATA